MKVAVPYICSICGASNDDKGDTYHREPCDYPSAVSNKCYDTETKEFTGFYCPYIPVGMGINNEELETRMGRADKLFKEILEIFENNYNDVEIEQHYEDGAWNSKEIFYTFRYKELLIVYRYGSVSYNDLKIETKSISSGFEKLIRRHLEDVKKREADLRWEREAAHQRHIAALTDELASIVEKIRNDVV